MVVGEQIEIHGVAPLVVEAVKAGTAGEIEGGFNAENG
jgi:hypothetical protein